MCACACVLARECVHMCPAAARLALVLDFCRREARDADSGAGRGVEPLGDHGGGVLDGVHVGELRRLHARK
eukprot:5562715-Pleurochrysis_carterae.AAC.1